MGNSAAGLKWGGRGGMVAMAELARGKWVVRGYYSVNARDLIWRGTFDAEFSDTLVGTAGALGDTVGGALHFAPAATGAGDFEYAAVVAGTGGHARQYAVSEVAAELVADHPVADFGGAGVYAHAAGGAGAGDARGGGGDRDRRDGE